MSKPLDLLLVGVGGQGTILASKVLSQVGLEAGYDVKMSEIHGMAQRGGSVVTQVRMGEKVYSPTLELASADAILAFERLEGLRYLSYLKPGGTIIINDQAIAPMPVLIGAAEYPENILEYIRSRLENVVVVDALQKAVDCGNAKAANVVLLGVLAKRLPLDKEIWVKALKAKVPEKLLEINLAAFEAGYEG
ncbi:Indolepyruvate ferredoxin oxidoreductase [Desulfofarcimen acetoxidans DSM 771]|jgi:indolepyruvate ferredoxin oxidoreductase beta subunit|uniref:Indolepyruvate ferredoxin oxidoreductase n=1 Tax=Desulfofarcimen acetoxidans (strain ATCC 49208 / DSM 771 / KCTC 5769 / VKM B-1644 / 5575) TaxID=485916 RepID=C8VVD9_DESAS|nr:indolepyruvate oxidoreductase subunit beta [Desulfofarcimen acetoxidans]ACV61009.1 Indolepyruvate ferredoxin oxidoreductase [Desulfofarcimen acetoxidans DSM 771]